MSNYLEQYEKWMNEESLNPEIKAELIAIKDNPKEIEERFYKSLEFGTGGLRGIMGAGTNRINIYTIRRSTQGLANHMKKQENGEKKAVIAYDNRHKSDEFALAAALVLAQNNIKTYVFRDITPTPILSYAIGELDATAGIVITASHNPKEYNGYKVYGSYGGQATDDDSEAIIEEVANIQDEFGIIAMDQKEAEEKGLLVWLGCELLDRYIERTRKLVYNPDIIEKVQEDLKIIYTPLHGTGSIPVMKLLDKSGFKNVEIVEEQANPDPNFTTAPYPNPEAIESFGLAIKQGKEKNADILLATDPDADRVGIVVKNCKGEYLPLTGNQLGGLLIDYILSSLKDQDRLPQNGVIVKTIVTSNLGVDIASKYGIDYVDVLTGFKYIGEKIHEFTQDENKTYIFGYEESYGFLANDFVRDKDAVQACLLAAEMAAYYKNKGITLYCRLEELFDELGYYNEDLVNITLEGIEGEKTINTIIEEFRMNPPLEIHDEKMVSVCDYEACILTNMIDNTEVATTLPESNVITYHLADDSWFAIRPSGTEPKLKIYFGVKGDTALEASTKLEGIKAEVMIRVNEAGAL